MTEEEFRKLALERDNNLRDEIIEMQWELHKIQARLDELEGKDAQRSVRSGK